jgi:3-oxoacyl-[acyl-carrier protein] reductase
MSLPASVSLSNRIAIVTGGSRGIGKAISLELARRGASVAIVYTNPQKSGTAKETVDEIKAVGVGAGGEKVNAIAIRADMRDPTAYERIVKETLEGFGTDKIHILGQSAPMDIYRPLPTITPRPPLIHLLTVHNAGLGSATPTPEVTSQTFSEVFDTNVRGPFFLTQAALPYIPSGSRIILVSSTSARLATVGFTTPIYTASKAALEGLARSWAYEVCESSAHLFLPLRYRSSLLRRKGQNRMAA